MPRRRMRGSGRRESDALRIPARIAGFLAQCRVESVDFTQLEENLNYTTPERIRQVFRSVHSMADAATLTRNPKALANRVYSGRLGNGWRTSKR